MSERNSLVPNQQPAPAPTVIPMGPTVSLDLSLLPEAQRVALLADYQKGMLDIAKKANELNVDVVTLSNTLTVLSGTTRQAQEQGTSVTVTHTQTTAIGRTEISMGNTDAAKSGRLTRSQSGQKDWTPVYIIGGIVAVVVIALAFAR